ncbi:3D-(3,5/4)-trihydroxycyclohexane-1,2-dione acylhydrolase (decyclizing) [Geminicoccus flavidas]|uniref:3D-(3,5/4)-trihydroxycyclohexane-1,2-dione acylhydrolase (decyclizing) n=1 Tax=Geminicoccus flavidas TaxID=2506407 RepID=UPI00135C6784|nr:3D-(3,5/4)-trihydroxycyclohexane-1,2-dione acylhydrolase (decyclizing) [Geminicoccus flavidas]
MKTVRLTMAQALVRWLTSQRTEIDGRNEPLFPGLFAIFGHGNVTCLSEALQEVQDVLPTWRGQNEQAMALAAIGFNKARKRRQIMIAASSIGPGATNMVTAAAVAHTNRLPLLLLSGDYYVSRFPDPVLQQVEHFGDPTLSVNDAFKPVVRYWDRITRPEQIIQSLPQALGMMLDPADCGPAFLGLCQDTQGEAFDYPERFFEPTVHHIPKPRADLRQIEAAVALLKTAKKPMIIAGGGVRYADAEGLLAAFAQRHGIPVTETLNGRTVLLHDDPVNCGPVGIMGSSSANHLAAEADVVLAIGTRLQDFTTGSWTLFPHDARFIGINTARFDARKHMSLPVVGDAAVTIEEMGRALGDWRAPESWLQQGKAWYGEWNGYIDRRSGPTNAETTTYAQVVGAVNRLAGERDLALTAAGGMPGELEMNWRAKGIGTFDCEFGFSCMGYEVAGGWGAAMADPSRDVFVMVGDGSYLLMNSDIYSSVLTGHKLIVVVCDNGGFAVIDRLQTSKGQPSFNNLIEQGTRVKEAFRVDFAKHAESMGAIGIRARSMGEFEDAVRQAKAADRTTVIHIDVHPTDWTGENGSWWECGTPEVSANQRVEEAFRAHVEGKKRQRLGV